MSQTNPGASDLVMVAERLTDVLNRENAALRAMDMQGAARLLAEKTDAVTDLEAALAAMADQPSDRPRMASGLRDRLGGLASENQRLLERALEVQGRIVSLVAQAAAKEVERQAPCYGATGAVTARSSPVVLLARA